VEPAATIRKAKCVGKEIVSYEID